VTTAAISAWLENVQLHPDVLSDGFSEDIFALDLGPLGDCLLAEDLGLSTRNLPSVPAVYRDPEHFFRASYLTSGLRSLLADALDRLGGGPGPTRQSTVELAFSADRNQLFTAWNALANLADMAGKVTIIVHAASEAGFDQSKLENGVWEPLRETKLID